MSKRLRRASFVCIALVLLLSSLAITGCTSQGAESSGTKDAEATDTITVQDSANRYVEVPYPVKSIVVLWDNPTEELKALGAIDRIVGIDEATKAKVDEGYYPGLADTPVVGSSEEPNYEAIAELDPDVVICLSSYPPLPDEVQAELEPFGIAVVSLDFFRTDVYFREVTTLGAMLGREEETASYIDFFRKPLDMVAKRIAEIADADRKTVYFEGADDYGTYGGAGYGCGIPGMIVSGGGVDLYPEITAEWFEADPEDIAERNPDFIIKGQSGGYFLADDTDFKAVHDAIMARPELAASTAVTQNQVHVMSFDVSGGARKKFGPMFIAKILYPETFEDFNPESVLKEYYEKYLGLEWQGVYTYPAINQ
ncbi:MAG: ABC transporter substrate-binding protein [Actinomycetota bacterium]|nr:ABC transporter substrate-binding protein [Actinomycetota bacterium]